MQISHFELHMLPKVSKTAKVAKTLTIVSLVKILTIWSELANFWETNRLKLELALESRTVFDAAPCRNYIFSRIYSESALLHLPDSLISPCLSLCHNVICNTFNPFNNQKLMESWQLTHVIMSIKKLLIRPSTCVDKKMIISNCFGAMITEYEKFFEHKLNAQAF
jgi:hypothetical protein